MIVVRSPLRITLGAGGTDLPPYCQEHGGLSITATIDKYVYVTVMQPFEPGISLKYSKLEKVATVDEVQHTIIREALRLMDVEPCVEITTLADIPGGTGLGTSSSLTTATLMALATYKHQTIAPEELADLACSIEIDRLESPIGKQDQHTSAYGGINRLTFHANGDVYVGPLEIPDDALVDLEENLMLFFTGYTRSSSEVLATAKLDKTFLDQAKAITEESIKALEHGDVRYAAQLMSIYWQEKRRYASNPQIDGWYDTARHNGAIGGKLVGAGGGGFLLFYADDRRRLRKAMQGCGLREVRFRFDFEGTKVVVAA